MLRRLKSRPKSAPHSKLRPQGTIFCNLNSDFISLATGGLIGILGYGFYTTVAGQAMNNVRAMGMRVGAQFALVAAGLTYYAINEVGMPMEVYERYKTTGKFLAHENPQAQLVRHKREE